MMMMMMMMDDDDDGDVDCEYNNFYVNVVNDDVYLVLFYSPPDYQCI